MLLARRLLSATLLCLCASGSWLEAWDEPGHEIIAIIAYGRLNPKAQQAVTELAREIPTDGAPYDAITASCWMDDLRKKDPAMPNDGLFFTWHYIDLGIEEGDPVPSFQPGTDNEANGNVVQALKRAWGVLQGGSDPYIKTKAMACGMILHLVGDVHQPLHAATHYFRTPGGWMHHDAGGNKELVVNGPTDDPKFNLHWFWDAAWRASFDPATGDVVIDKRYDEAGSHDPAAVRDVAAELSREPLPAGVNLQPDFETWARESHDLAQSFVYRELTATESKKECRLSSAYVARANAIARGRLELAAARLAVMLNQALGSETPVAPPPPYPAGPAEAGPVPTTH